MIRFIGTRRRGHLLGGAAGLDGTVKVSGRVIPVRYSAGPTADAHTRIQAFLAAHLK